jgi:hypothetical protein
MTGFDLPVEPGRRCRLELVALATAALAFTTVACTPRVALEAPKEPITINLNVNLDADVRLRLEDQAREDIEENPEIF